MSDKKMKYVVWSRLTEVKDRHCVIDIVNSIIHSKYDDLMEARRMASDLNRISVIFERQSEKKASSNEELQYDQVISMRKKQ